MMPWQVEVVPGTSRRSTLGGGPLAASSLRMLMMEGVLVMRSKVQKGCSVGPSHDSEGHSLNSF